MPLTGPFNSMSIFNKRMQTSNQNPPIRPTSQFGAGYDGLGGHSKVDEFPTPVPKLFKKTKSSGNLSQSKSKKLSAPPAGVPKLSQFNGFINLD